MEEQEKIINWEEHIETIMKKATMKIKSLTQEKAILEEEITEYSNLLRIQDENKRGIKHSLTELTKSTNQSLKLKLELETEISKLNEEVLKTRGEVLTKNKGLKEAQMQYEEGVEKKLKVYELTSQRMNVENENEEREMRILDEKNSRLMAETDLLYTKIQNYEVYYI